ncbi:MAG: DUF4249 family protein [Balneolaceae bacterium]
MKYLIYLLILLGFFMGCDPQNQDSYEEYIAVESYIVANSTLPIVKISHTLPVDEEYSFENSAISGANVQITLLDEDGNDVENFNYVSTPVNGIYRAVDVNERVLPLQTYRLDINFNDREDELTAYTTVPDEFSVINDIPEVLEYQGDEQLELILSPTIRAQSQNVYVFNTIVDNPEANKLTPFYLSAVIDGDSEAEDFSNNSSGLVNEGNFTINDDGTTTLLFPWIGVAFYGENKIVVNSIDSNLNNFIRSQDVQLGGSTLPPGEIPNVRFNIEGGIGVFGSIASDTVTTFFTRPDGS